MIAASSGRRVCFVNRFCYSDSSATSQLLTDLAGELSVRGWQVTMVACSQRYDDPTAQLPASDRWRGVDIRPVSGMRFGRASRDSQVGCQVPLRFVDHGHGQRESLPPDQVGTVSAPFDHYNFSKGINDWFARHLRYARAEAVQALVEPSEPLHWDDLIGLDPTVRRRALKRLASLSFRGCTRRWFYRPCPSRCAWPTSWIQ